MRTTILALCLSLVSLEAHAISRYNSESLTCGRADRMYQRGYYYDAKRAGLLDETGLGRDRVRRRRG